MAMLEMQKKSFPALYCPKKVICAKPRYPCIIHFDIFDMYTIFEGIVKLKLSLSPVIWLGHADMLSVRQKCIIPPGAIGRVTICWLNCSFGHKCCL